MIKTFAIIASLLFMPIKASAQTSPTMGKVPEQAVVPLALGDSPEATQLLTEAGFPLTQAVRECVNSSVVQDELTDMANQLNSQHDALLRKRFSSYGAGMNICRVIEKIKPSGVDTAKSSAAYIKRVYPALAENFCAMSQTYRPKHIPTTILPRERWRWRINLSYGKPAALKL